MVYSLKNKLLLQYSWEEGIISKQAKQKNKITVNEDMIVEWYKIHTNDNCVLTDLDYTHKFLQVCVLEHMSDYNQS